MFWRFGSEEESRPVAATAWAYDVWIRPVRASISPGSLSVYVDFSFVIARYSSTSRGRSNDSASCSSTLSAVDG
jgi:hypothetical protein